MNIQKAIKNVDKYVKTNESRNYWAVFKQFNKNIEINDIRSFNQFQYNWIIYL